MLYRTLGRTGLKVSLVGFGTGGPSSFGQSAELAQSQQTELVRQALDLGINFFDTSSEYGDSENILGKALEGIPRDKYYLSTKWAHASNWSPKGAGGKDGAIEEDPQALVRSTEKSLRRLKTDTIDVMQFHGLRPQQYTEVVERFGPVMQTLQSQGKIRFIGMTVRYIADPSFEAAKIALETDPSLWDTVMIKYGILNQSAKKEILPLAIKHDVGVINMAAVRYKLPNPTMLQEQLSDWKDRRLIPENSLPTHNSLDWLIQGDVTSVIDAGYKFAAEHPAISTVLTGTANKKHLEQNVAALEDPSLPVPHKQRLEDLFGSIAEYA